MTFTEANNAEQMIMDVLTACGIGRGDVMAMREKLASYGGMLGGEQGWQGNTTHGGML